MFPMASQRISTNNQSYIKMSTRNLQDYFLKTTKALPAAGATANATAIDLGSVTLGAAAESCELLIELPATPSLADTKKVTITVEDSADNSSFAAIGGLATLVATGAGGAGAAATSQRYKLPTTTRRYLRFSAAVEASGGTNTAVSVTAKLLT